MNFLKASEWGKHKKKSIIWSRRYLNDPFPEEVRNSTGNSFSWKLQGLCSFRLRGSMIEAIVLVESKLSCCAYQKIHSGRGTSWQATLFFYCQLCIYAQHNLLHSVYFKALKNHTNCTLHAQSADFKGSWLSQIKINLHQNIRKHFFLLRAISMLNFNSLLDFFFLIFFYFFGEKLQKKNPAMVKVVFFTSFICQIMEPH